MLDLLGAKVYNLPTSNTRGLSVNDYMKVMGASSGRATKSKKEDGFEPIEPAKGVLQTGTDATKQYYDSLESLNSFGLQASAKGYDVFNPGRDIQSRNISKEFMRRLQNVQQQGNGLRAGQELSKFHTQQRLKNGIIGPGAIQKDEDGFVGPTTGSQMDQLINTNPIVKQLNHEADQMNKMAKSYDTRAEMQDANMDIDRRKADLDKFRKYMEESGIPPEQVDFILSTTKDSINKATHDGLGEQKLAAKKAADLRRDERAGQRIGIQRARLNETKKKGRKTDEDIILRKELIKRIQLGDPGAAGSLVGGTFGKGKIIESEFLEGGDAKVNTGELDEFGNEIFVDSGNPSVNTLKLKVREGSSTKTYELQMGKEQAGSFNELNNVINTVSGQEKFSIEELSRTGESNFSGQTQKMTLQGFGEVTMKQLKEKYTPEQIDQLRAKGLLK